MGIRAMHSASSFLPPLSSHSPLTSSFLSACRFLVVVVVMVIVGRFRTGFPVLPFCSVLWEFFFYVLSLPKWLSFCGLFTTHTQRAFHTGMLSYSMPLLCLYGFYIYIGLLLKTSFCLLFAFPAIIPCLLTRFSRLPFLRRLGGSQD